MKVLFVNRFYWPETPATGQLLTDLAEGLVGLGWEVTVITSAASAEAPTRQVHRGVKILRVTGTRWARHGTFGKAIDFGTFYFGALWRVLREAQRGTRVIPMTDPPMVGVGVGWAASCRRARMVHWIQDIYPEIAIELFGHRWLRVLRPLRNLAWRSADACVTIGSDMAKALTTAGVRGERTVIVPNWGPAGVAPLERASADTGCISELSQPGATPERGSSQAAAGDLALRALPMRLSSDLHSDSQRQLGETPTSALRREWGLTGKFVVAYSGNLGRVHDLESVVALAETLRNEPEIAVILVGDGAQRRALEAMARERALTNLTFHPPQPREGLRDTLAVGDLHLVTLRPGCENYVFPSKLYGIAAAGRPILFIGPTDCEVARCVIANGLGHVAVRGDIAAMAAAVRHLSSDSSACARHRAQCLHFAERHTASVAVEKWHTLLSSIAGSPQTPSNAQPGGAA